MVLGGLFGAIGRGIAAEHLGPRMPAGQDQHHREGGRLRPRDPRRLRSRATAPADAPLRPGERVTHRAFGPGTVVAVKLSGRGDSELAVAFDGAGIKKLLLSLASLERG